jgi:uncharacterized protein YecE (DUF72 family)
MTRPASGVARVGIAGWTYAPWRGVFYPDGLPHRAELAYAADRLDSIELNGSFYALQRPSSWRRWDDQTPDDFVFAVKGGRYITHILRLKNTRAALANFFATGMLTLGGKLGPLLWQLPPNLPFDAVELATFLESLPRTTAEAAALAAASTLDEDRRDTSAPVDRPLRHAVEARHGSFADPEFARIARDHGVAVVVADTAGRYPLVREPTTGFVYIRLHGDEELYSSGYTDEALDRWADEVRARLRDGLDAYVYFDNDLKVRAPFDAMALRDCLRDSR